MASSPLYTCFKTCPSRKIRLDSRIPVPPPTGEGEGPCVGDAGPANSSQNETDRLSSLAITALTSAIITARGVGSGFCVRRIAKTIFTYSTEQVKNSRRGETRPSSCESRRWIVFSASLGDFTRTDVSHFQQGIDHVSPFASAKRSSGVLSVYPTFTKPGICSFVIQYTYPSFSVIFT